MPCFYPAWHEFDPKSVQSTTIVKFCSMIGWSQRFAILEWGLVNPEKISEFLHRMKVDKIFRSYYYGLYDSLRLLYRRIYDESSVIVIQAEKHWTTKLDHVLKEQPGPLECCEEEITARRARASWLDQIKADELND